MSHQPHIVRQQETELLREMTKALEVPESSPVLFHVWGISGIGKSTLLNAIEERFKQKADCSKFSFGGGNETPFTIMEKLYQNLPEHKEITKLGWSPKNKIKPDSFLQKYNTYKTTLNELETKPVEGQNTVGKDQKEQISNLKQLTKFAMKGAVSIGGVIGWVPPTSALTALSTMDGMVDSAFDAGINGLSLRDSLLQMLQNHKVTKDKPELQSLMLDPFKNLTDAFVDDLEGCAKQRPVILILDTYEKSTPEIDIWLRQFLLTNKKLKKSKVRIIISGCNRLIKTEEWRELNSSHNLIIREIASLKEFDRNQVADYANKIGISDRREIHDLWKNTNGFPFHLDLIRQSKQDGEPINCPEEISERLLKGLNLQQKQLVKFAACCRLFDQSLVEHLTIIHDLKFFQDADPHFNHFNWLKQFSFVEYDEEGYYRLKDVAKDRIRESLFQQNQGKTFREIHLILHKYFEELCNEEVPQDSPVSEQYKNPLWCQYRAEAIYHAFYSLRRNECKFYFLNYFFASRYFGQIDIVMTPFNAISAEVELEKNYLLPDENKKFLQDIKILLPFGWFAIISPPNRYEIKINEAILSQSLIDKIETTFIKYLDQVEYWDDGLGKLSGLKCKFLRSHQNEKIRLLKKAQYQAELLEATSDSEFTSNLFREVGDFFYGLNQYKETINCYDQVIRLNPSSSEAYNNRGIALDNLEKYEDAITNYNRAIDLNPSSSEAWNNRGFALANLEKYKDAITSYNRAIDLNPTLFEAWNNRGIALDNLEKYEDAVTNYKQAIKLKFDYLPAWINRGFTLVTNLEKYVEAIADFNQAIELKSDCLPACVGLGIAQTRIGKYDDALDSFNRALEIDPNELKTKICLGVLSAWMGQHQQGIESCDVVLKNHPNNPDAFYGKSCCYALQGNIEQAIEYLKLADTQKRNHYKKRAKKEPEFNGIREDSRFQELLNE